MRQLVIGQRQKAPNFSGFHWSPHGCLITIGQHFVSTRVVHLRKRTETSLITESDQSRVNHQLLQLCTARTAWSDSDQAVRAVHSCKSWFYDNYADWVVSQNLNKLWFEEVWILFFFFFPPSGFQREITTHFLFASLDYKILPKGLLLKKRICFHRSKFFSCKCWPLFRKKGSVIRSSKQKSK